MRVCASADADSISAVQAIRVRRNQDMTFLFVRAERSTVLATGMPKLAGARRCFRRAPLINQTACKPGSVGPRPFARTRRDGHSSGTTLARCLEQPTRTASLTSLPRRYRIKRTTRVAAPIRSCSRCGLPCHSCCEERGGLLPHPFPLAAPWSEDRGGRFALCGTFPGVAPAGRYPAPFVLEPGLSSPATFR